MAESTPIIDLAKRLAAEAEDRTAFWSRLIAGAGLGAVAEIGVFRGRFAEQILRACPGIATYHMVDPWRTLEDWNKPNNRPQGEFEAIFAEAKARTAFAADRIRIHRERTIDVHPQFEDASLDLLYVDGDHTLRGVAIDLMTMFPKVREGGVIGGDDFGRRRQHDPRFEPTMVCPFAIYFAEAMGVPILCLPHAQFLIVKDRSHGFELIDLVGGYDGVTVNAVTQPRRAQG